MNNSLVNIIKYIDDKIDKLNQEKNELIFILNNDSVLEDKIGNYLNEIKIKFNELLNYINSKLEICELKKKKYENELYEERYNIWLKYIQQKQEYITKLTETLDNTDLILELDEIDFTEISETNTFHKEDIDIYDKKEV